MKINMPQAVKEIIATLQQNNFEAYAVGGCVRDSILGREPNDWDITTSASPEEVKALFRRTIDTGIEHGTVTIMVDKVGYEVTTYRIDGKYEDGRHPTEVTFTRNLKEDLLRRDFTINAMAYNDTDGLVDIFGGMEDIEHKVIRCVGDPKARFTEDALRLMRAIRFAAQLGYTIEEETREAMKEIAGNLKKISAERIQVELVKTLVSPNPFMMKDAYELGLTKYFMPEFDLAMETMQNNPHHMYTVGEHSLVSVTQIRPDKVLRLAMLMHDFGKPLCITTDEKGIDHYYGHPAKSEEMAREILHRLKFDNDTIRKVCVLIRHHDERIVPGVKYMRRAVARIGEDAFPDLFEVQEADIFAQSQYKKESKLSALEANRRDYEEMRALNQCVSKAMLAVSGKDLIDCGMKPGKEIGRVLDAMLQDVIEEPNHNEKEYLLKKFLPCF
ncbi:MAG: CCA tRNA nucleotidyltransferase [Lachnospiraceae bacterium]|nr:CCA tRNA nucleotidyltransferase [Lachnospiraceae bacterium]